MALQVCVDASLVLKLVLPEDNSDAVQQQWLRWIMADVEFVAPPLFVFEGVSAIRLNVSRRLITPAAADLAFQIFLDQIQEVQLLLPHDLHARAWSLAKRFKQSHVYDAYYLALAESLGCEFWTADERLYRATHRTFGWVKRVPHAA